MSKEMLESHVYSLTSLSVVPLDSHVSTISSCCSSSTGHILVGSSILFVMLSRTPEVSETENASSDAFRAKDSEDRLCSSYQRKASSLSFAQSNSSNIKYERNKYPSLRNAAVTMVITIAFKQAVKLRLHSISFFHQFF
ncbi:Os08g0547550 [Oryza sativa Japonica Group]|uniref:Os08g0547550 protein n=1 Tax=Oryza sativa subsp. japonica TaxID=39947 RepID=A0A0P0XIM3_ORYSJ|nr:hypothetical protein EE612_045759 [Oryza sativa]BAT06557.1 Os08g0547550 [Oryza sativa Japonica Group]